MLIDGGIELLEYRPGHRPDEFAAVIKSEIPNWAKVIKEAAIKSD